MDDPESVKKVLDEAEEDAKRNFETDQRALTWCRQAQRGEYPIFICCRTRGHAGDHIAWGAGDGETTRMMDRWEQEPVTPPTDEQIISLLTEILKELRWTNERLLQTARMGSTDD